MLRIRVFPDGNISTFPNFGTAATRFLARFLSLALMTCATIGMFELSTRQAAAAQTDLSSSQRAGYQQSYNQSLPKASTVPPATAVITAAPRVRISLSPSELTVQAGAALQLTAVVTGTTNTRVTWTASLGTITPSGLYIAPSVPAQTVDTVFATSSADPTQYAATSVTVAGSTTGCAGPYSIINQEPITCVPSPGSLFAKRLPSDVMSHRMANDVTIAVSSLRACNPGQCSSQIVVVHSGSANDINGIPTYYGNATDPAYKISGGYTPVSPYTATNVGFHAPNQAMTSGASSEQFFTVWDQTQNKYFTLYRYTGGSGSHQTKFPPCSSKLLTAPCSIGFSPSDSMKNLRGETLGYGVGGGNPWASNSLVPPIGMIRVQELIQGHIYHPIYLNVLCEANNPNHAGQAAAVFPDTLGYGARPCSALRYASNVAYAPPAGALYFLDYTDSQLALLKSYLPAWQYPIVEALTHYGGYIGDTGNPLHPSRLENEDAYKTAGLRDPIFTWLHGQKGINSDCGGATASCILPWTNFAVAGGTCPAAGLCDITRHIHIANPCIAKGLAGMTSTQGACF